jgi:hypothetical protein
LLEISTGPDPVPTDPANSRTARVGRRRRMMRSDGAAEERTRRGGTGRSPAGDGGFCIDRAEPLGAS